MLHHTTILNLPYHLLALYYHTFSPLISYLLSTHHQMRVRDSFDVRTMSVELSDSLSLLELNEYAEDLYKTGR
jgi:hypothetical protein